MSACCTAGHSSSRCQLSGSPCSHAADHELPPPPPRCVSDLARVKDEKHLQRPQRGQWAVMLEPLPPEKPTKKKEKPAAPAGDAAEQLGEAAAGGGEGGGDEAAAGAAAPQDAGTAPLAQ